MKEKSAEHAMVRKLSAENIILRRKTAKGIRDYALYDLSKRKLRSIYGNRVLKNTITQNRRIVKVLFYFV